MTNPSEAQTLPTAVPPTVQAGERDYIVIDLNARSDDGRQKQAAFHWYAGKPDDEYVKTSKGHWFIDLEAFDLLIKWCQEKYPPLDHAEELLRAENKAASWEQRFKIEQAAKEQNANLHDRIVDELHRVFRDITRIHVDAIGSAHNRDDY